MEEHIKMRRENEKSLIKKTALFFLISTLFLTACTKKSNTDLSLQSIDSEKEQIKVEESTAIKQTDEPIETSEKSAPNKETVMKMREYALEGMTEEQIKRLTENVKVNNLGLENQIVFDNLWGKLSDPNNLMWNCLDKTGEVQIGWAFESSYPSLEESGLTEEEYNQTYGVPVITYNDYDADSYISLIDDITGNIQNDDLKADLALIKESLSKAKESHDVNEVVKIYQILHDMDYYLLRYAPEDVGQYVRDTSTIDKYYDVLTIYK